MSAVKKMSAVKAEVKYSSFSTPQSREKPYHSDWKILRMVLWALRCILKAAERHFSASEQRLEHLSEREAEDRRPLIK